MNHSPQRHTTQHPQHLDLPYRVSRRQLLALLGIGMAAVVGQGTTGALARNVSPRWQASAERTFTDTTGKVRLQATVRWYEKTQSAIDAFGGPARPVATPESRVDALERAPYTVTELTPPTDLTIPGRFAAHTKTEGAAAVQSAIITGRMLREHLIWSIAMTSNDFSDLRRMSETVFTLATALSTRKITSNAVHFSEVEGFRGGLWDVLPKAADVPADMLRIEEEGDGQLPS